MYISQQVIFTLINFGIFVALVWYLYKRYGKQLLYQMLYAREHELELLRQEKYALKNEQDVLSQTKQEEQRLATELIEKAKQWKKVFQQQRADQLEKQQQIRSKLSEKRRRQAQLHAQQCLYNTIMPQVIGKARGSLLTTFDSPEKTASYTNEIITYLKKRQR